MLQSIITLLIVAGTLGSAQSARSAEIKVLAPGALRSTMMDVIPKYEKSSNNKVVIDYGSVTQLAERVAKGQSADARV